MPFRLVALVGAVAAAVVLAVPVDALAQKTSAPPLTAWGAPDLQGVWDFRSLTPMERPRELKDKEVFTPEEAATFAERTVRRESRDQADTRVETAAGRVVPYNDFWFDWGSKVTTERTSLIVDPPDGRIPPLTPAAQKQRAARAEARRGVGTDEVSPGGWIDELSAPVRCLVGFNQGPPMTPSAYNNNMQLFQTRDHVVILNEMIHEARIVPLDGRPHLPQSIRQWMGSSRGRWEGKTLVVETTNRRDNSFRGASRNLRLIERFTRTDADTLVYEVTLDDPSTWTKPWTFMVPMAKGEGNVYEYACHEGNYYMANMLSGQLAEGKAGAVKK